MEITPATATITVGERVTFTASGSVRDWVSSNPAIVVVSRTGTAIGRAEGVATITALYKNTHADAEVTVTSPRGDVAPPVEEPPAPVEDSPAVEPPQKIEEP